VRDGLVLRCRFVEPRDVLKNARAAKGLTQQQLADLLPVGIDAVRAIERGRDQPSLRTALAIDQALDAGGAIAAAFGFSSINLLRDVEQLREQVANLTLDVTNQGRRIEELAGKLKQQRGERPRSARGSR
jgi:transcriptional regulator with XRE-family HTH domain